MSLSKLSGKTTLFIGSYPPPYGGVSSLLENLGERLYKANCNYNVLHFSADFNTTTKKNGAIVHRIKRSIFSDFIFSIINKPILTIKSIFLMAGFLNIDLRLYLSSLLKAISVSNQNRKIKADSIFVFTTKEGAMIPFLSILEPNAKIYYCIFADPYKEPDFYKKHFKWFRKAMLVSEKVFSSSNYCAQSIKNFAPELDTHHIYVGVDTKRFKPGNNNLPYYEKINIPKNKKIILFVGRMEAEMGAGYCLEIAKEVIKQNDDCVFIVAGGSGSLTDVVIEAQQQNPGRIFCRENVSFEDLPMYYNICSLLIAPTIGNHACMGVSIKEAMASGKPCIVSNSGGIPEAIRSGIDGEIIPLNDNGKINITQFSSSIIKIIKDGELRKKYGKNSRERAMNVFSLESTASEYAKLIIR